MKRNDYYCFINEKKLTEEEWNECHAKEVEHGEEFDGSDYWHCDTYEIYSKAFDECMKEQIENRNSLRAWYVRLMKAPFTDEWAQSISDFSDCFKSCYGYRPKFYDDMLHAKGITREDVCKAWERLNKED